MARMAQPRTWRVDVQREVMPVTDDRETQDPNWRHEDQQGHVHTWGSRTMEWITTASHWCNGDEGIAPHDPHEAIDDGYWRCAQCHEQLKPGMRPPFTTYYIPGMVTATLTGVRSDGAEVDVVLSEADYNRIRTATDPDVVAAELLDAGNPVAMRLTWP